MIALLVGGLLISPVACQKTAQTAAMLSSEPTASEPADSFELLPPLTPGTSSITPVIAQALNISVEPQPGASIAEGITLERVNVGVGIMDFAGGNGWTDIRLKPGDPCLLISVILSNTTSHTLYVSIFANGYAAKGNQVAWTVDSGPLMGILAITIPADSSRYVNLHPNWTAETRLIRIGSGSYTEPIP